MKKNYLKNLKIMIAFIVVMGMGITLGRYVLPYQVTEEIKSPTYKVSLPIAVLPDDLSEVNLDLDTVSSFNARKIINNELNPNVSLNMLNNLYQIPTLENMMDLIAWHEQHLPEPSSSFNCNAQSQWFKSIMRTYYGLNNVGTANDLSMSHSYNLFLANYQNGINLYLYDSTSLFKYNLWQFRGRDYYPLTQGTVEF